MERRITITENAYFYIVIKPLTNRVIERVIKEASDHKTGKYLYRNLRVTQTIKRKDFTTTLVVFKYQSEPSFLLPGVEWEVKYGYLLLVEYGNYLVVSKRGTSDFNKLLEDYISELPYETISKFRVNGGTTFRKMSMSNLETGKSVLRRLQYEAADIKQALSTVTSSNKVLSNIRIKNTEHETAIAVSTSRINQLGKKTDFETFCIWAATICEAVDAYTPSQNFIDNFAEPLSFAASIGALRPVSVFFELYPLLEDMSTGAIKRIYYLNGEGIERDLNIVDLTRKNDYGLEVQPTADAHRYKILSDTAKDLQLKIATKSIDVISSRLRRIIIEWEDGETNNLLQYINKEGLFIVSFDNCEIRYKAKGLYRDSKLLGNIPYFLNFIETDPLIPMLRTEKGLFTPTSTHFDPTCLFGAIENQFATDCDYLICDDLGDEWADYIGVKNHECIRFYHAKSSEKLYSASAFHDVVSQALKNIGHFDFNKDLSAKRRKIGERYSGTAIQRLRNGSSVTDCFNSLRETYNYPNVQKEVVLVINFLSKAELEHELGLLTTGGAKNQTIQILWVLSSLVCVCQEKGIRLRIITKP